MPRSYSCWNSQRRPDARLFFAPESTPGGVGASRGDTGGSAAEGGDGRGDQLGDPELDSFFSGLIEDDGMISGILNMLMPEDLSAATAAAVDDDMMGVPPIAAQAEHLLAPFHPGMGPDGMGPAHPRFGAADRSAPHHQQQGAPGGGEGGAVPGAVQPQLAQMAAASVQPAIAQMHAAGGGAAGAAHGCWPHPSGLLLGSQLGSQPGSPPGSLRGSLQGSQLPSPTLSREVVMGEVAGGEAPDSDAFNWSQSACLVTTDWTGAAIVPQPSQSVRARVSLQPSLLFWKERKR